MDELSSADQRRYQRLESLFHECLDLQPRARTAFLEQRCGDDPALRAEVLELLSREPDARSLPRIIKGDAEPIPGTHAEGATPRADQDPAPQRANNHAAARQSDHDPTIQRMDHDPATRPTDYDPAPRRDPELASQIGPYTLLRKLGEGGFGDVYEAEQSSPVRRRVAIKILKAGMDSRAVLARFETERQALALMDHPGIAKVYDAGMTPSGRPFFAMELVRGKSIVDYCEDERLSLRDRLSLFVPVCRAIEHAHQKGVLHRDIKPSNILVSSADGKPQPRIIDFGIAKAISDPISGETIQTQIGELLGTPEYMSPEQALSGGVDVDARTDVYSLGVVLYRLVTGKHPFDPERLRRIGLVEVQRVLRDEDPPRPSEIVPQAREVRGDVEWIVLKAMEKDRDRRYASAAALAEEIERFQRNEPVHAIAPSAFYRTRKLVRRHRGLALGVAVVLMALLVGWITATTLLGGAAAMIVVLLSGFAATFAQARRARRAEAEARSQAESATAVNAFLTRMLMDANPELNPGGREVTLRETVDRAARELEERSTLPPRVEAGIRHALGSTYQGLGLYDEAERHTNRAAELWMRALGPAAPETIEGRLAVAKLLMRRGAYPQAEAFLTALGTEIEHAPALSADLRARFLEIHGENLVRLNRFDEAQSMLEPVVAMRERSGGSAYANSLALLSRLYEYQGRYLEAAAVARRALAAARQAYAGDHVAIATAASMLAGALASTKELAESETCRREAIAIYTRLFGRDHPDTAMAVGNLGITLSDLGRADEAIACQREAVQTLTRALGKDASEVARAKVLLAISLQTRGDLEEALELHVSSIEIQRRLHGPQHSDLAASLNNLGALYRLMGRSADALPVFVEAEAMFRKAYGQDHPVVAIAINNVGKAYLDLQRFEEAEAYFEESLAIAVRVLPPRHLSLGILKGNQGITLAGLDRKEEAEFCLLEAYTLISENLGVENPRTRQLASEIARFYVEWGRVDEAAKWRFLSVEAGSSTS